ncbi:MipA/OmpV family protein [Thiofilum flexile]|uniref:MipA/OmpV family protein n=1 Tax=Thiofilum flexile TaxID=125627 RepID=UPI00037FEE2C|nr:MipA/OmpV family protein [Thiofilum flexile]
MIKYSSYLILSIGLCATQWVYAENELLLGINTQIEPSIYKEGKNRVQFSAFKLDREGFYLPGPSFNVHRSATNRTYIGAGLDPWERKRGNSSITSGMDDLDYAINLRAGTAHKTRLGVFGVDVMHDFNAHKGNQARLRYIKPIQSGRRLWLPQVAIQWLDKDVGNYYFGVKSSEATSTRPAYQLGSSAVLKAGVDVELPLSQSFMLSTGVGVTSYSNAIKNSPLVEKGSAPYVKVGLAYRFR